MRLQGIDGQGQDTEVLNLEGELTWAQLDTLVDQALQTPDQDCEGLLNRVRERLERCAGLSIQYFNDITS